MADRISCLNVCAECIEQKCFAWAKFKDPSMERFSINGKKRLGEGGFGVTFLGTDLVENADVACKCLRLSRLSGQLQTEVQHEVRLLESLLHPNIVKLHGAGMRGPDYVIVMEKLSVDLFTVIASTKDGLSPKTAAQYFADVLRGVAHCHRSGIVHRDVKLENAMLDERGRVKLIDFGLAHKYERFPESATVDGSSGVGGSSGEQFVNAKLRSVVGSQVYVAPEVWARSGYSYPSDIWSCAVALFAMLHKCYPMEKAASTDWRFRQFAALQRRGRLQRSMSVVLSWDGKANNMSPELNSLFEVMLVVDSDQRMSAERLLKTPWLQMAAASTPGWKMLRLLYRSSAALPVFRGSRQSDSSLREEDDKEALHALREDDGEGGSVILPLDEPSKPRSKGTRSPMPPPSPFTRQTAKLYEALIELDEEESVSSTYG